MWYSILIFALIILIYSRVINASTHSVSSIKESLEFLEIGLLQVEKLAEQVDDDEARRSVTPLLSRARIILEDLKSNDFNDASKKSLEYAGKLVESAGRDVTKARRILEPFFEDEDDNWSN